MSTEPPPPPPQVSPDGKFYWDGTRWVPVQSQSAVATQVPAGYEIKKKGHGLRNGAIGCLGLIVLIVIISIAAASGNHSGGSSNPAASSPAASTAPVALKVLLDKTGSGTNTTPKFTAGGDWEIDWSYNCTGFGGGTGNFQVYVYNGDGTPSDVAVNELGAKGSDVTYEHQGGTYYLEMNSECNWHVIVKG